MYNYDNSGNVTEVKDGEESQTYEYDSEGNLISFTDEEGDDTSYAYDTTGSLTGVTATATITYGYGNTNWKDILTTWNGQKITYD